MCNNRHVIIVYDVNKYKFAEEINKYWFTIVFSYYLFQNLILTVNMKILCCDQAARGKYSSNNFISPLVCLLQQLTCYDYLPVIWRPLVYITWVAVISIYMYLGVLWCICHSCCYLCLPVHWRPLLCLPQMLRSQLTCTIASAGVSTTAADISAYLYPGVLCCVCHSCCYLCICHCL